MTGSAVAASCSCNGLELGHSFQRVDLVPAREGKERLVGRGAVRKVSFENLLDGARRLFSDDVAINFAPERRVRPKAAADQNVIALDRVRLFVRLDFAGQEPDLGNEMLGARVVAAGQVDVDRRVEFNAGFAPARNLLGMALGV